MNRPAFGHPLPRRTRRRPVPEGQTTLVLLTLIRPDAPPLQVLAGGLVETRRAA